MLSRILALLEETGVEYESLDHPPVSSCDDSLARRQAAGWTGASSKCILFHAKGVFHLVVTTADRAINARHFKKQFGTKNIRFAKPEEVLEHAGCAIGSLPPVLPGVPDVTSFVDRAILVQEHFMFNPADPERSLRILSRDLPRLLKASGSRVVWFADNAEGRLDFFEAGT
jgi:Ala-tRNA(Pro) deacylase